MARDIEARMQEVEGRIEALDQELQTLRREAHGGPVADYALSDADGRVTLAQLFGECDRLIVIHNMGFACPYCTMWADGFNGLLPYIEERAAFVLTSPDSVEQQQKSGGEARLEDPHGLDPGQHVRARHGLRAGRQPDPRRLDLRARAGRQHPPLRRDVAGSGRQALLGVELRRPVARAARGGAVGIAPARPSVERTSGQARST